MQSISPTMCLDLPASGCVSVPAFVIYPHTQPFSLHAPSDELTSSQEDVLYYRAAEGDVLSHLTAVKDLEYDGRHIEVELLPNPSHLGGFPFSSLFHSLLTCFRSHSS